MIYNMHKKRIRTNIEDVHIAERDTEQIKVVIQMACINIAPGQAAQYRPWMLVPQLMLSAMCSQAYLTESKPDP